MFHVLLPVDESVERAHSQAEFLQSVPCKEQDVGVIVAHAPIAEESDEIDNHQDIERIGSVKEAIDILEREGIQYTIEELATPVAEAIIDLTSSRPVDVIVMGGRKRTPAEKAILGSVSQSVILESDTPVVLTGPRGAE